MTQMNNLRRGQEPGDSHEMSHAGKRVETAPAKMYTDAGGHEQNERFVRRTSTTPTTDRPFDRSMSAAKGSKDSSSLVSVHTRTSRVSKATYHGDLKPDLSTKLTWQLLLTVFTIVFGCSFQFGFNIGVLNQPENLIKSFFNSTYADRRGSPVSSSLIEFFYALTTSLFIPGGIAGAFLGGYLADKIGRKNSILIAQIFVLAGSVMCTLCQFASSPELIMIGRLLLGINSGMGNCIAPMYLQEIAPYTFKGAFGTTHQLFITLGIFVSSVLGISQILGTAGSWPYLLLVMSVPAVFTLCVLPFLPDSPRYLLLISLNRKRAERALQFFRSMENVCADMEEMDTEHIHETKKGTYTIKHLFTSPDLYSPLLICCMLQVVQQFSGINSIFLYSRTIFLDANVPDEQIPFAVIGTNAVNVFMTIISVMLMDKAGRRLLLLVPMAVMIIDLAVITISLNFQDKFDWMAYISLCCVITYVISFAIGLGPIPMMVGSELFRQGPRPAAMTVAGVVNWVCTFAIAIGFKNVQEKTGKFTFIIFLVLMIFFILFVFFKVPETKNKTFEEIAHQFSPGSNIEVEEAVDDINEAPSPPVFPEDSVDTSDHKLVTLDFPHRTSPPESPEQEEPLLARAEDEDLTEEGTEESESGTEGGDEAVEKGLSQRTV